MTKKMITQCFQSSEKAERRKTFQKLQFYIRGEQGVQQNRIISPEGMNGTERWVGNRGGLKVGEK